MLRRVYVEPFVDARMETLESIAEAVNAGRLPTILSADAPLQHLGAVRLNAAETQQVLHGRKVACAGTAEPGRVRLYGPTGRFLGLGEMIGGEVRPRRLFAQ
jgi:tRNA pseudouridine55 synthase